ncbi:unnamed protein product [Rhizoctonia solani]|uniref:F-box domain-containing protein n=1 Tax=Rhizoctonia solani TaxID=456999 RepID=A0A8H3CF61_9AGAM|nr:unnamed protein product [Rhizoctonia solani]
MTSNAQNTLLPPEIVQKIASYCEYREQRDLAYTCRWFFSSIIPVIWKEVHGAEVIMKLIPGVKVGRSYKANEGDYEIFDNIEFNESLLVGDWARYWYYAPFVRYIEPFSSLEATVCVWGWHFLFTKLQGRVVLPNLHTLNTKGLYSCSHFDRLAWFVVLLPPSLHELNLEDILSDIDYDHPRCLSLLLGAISKSSSTASSRISVARDEWCPSEQTLASFFPRDYTQGSFWFGNVSAPINLRDLKVTLFSSSTLWDELCVIGSLPVLESLGVIFDHREISSNDARHSFNDKPLPPSAFPSLHDLRLKGASSVGLFRWIWGLKSMVSGLLSADINVPNFGLNPRSLSTNFAQLIHNNSPNLTTLSINMNASNGMGTLEIACELLSVIPLQTLMFDDWFIGKVGDYPAAHSESNFRHLRRLNISSAFDSSDWATLPKIAKAFPNLEYLCMRSSTRSESYEYLDISRINYIALQPIEIELSVHCIEREKTRDEEQWSKIRNDITNAHHLLCHASFLKTVWPNASIAIDSSHPYYIVRSSDTTIDGPDTIVQDDLPNPENAEIQITRNEGPDMYRDVLLLLSCIIAWVFGVFWF